MNRESIKSRKIAIDPLDVTESLGYQTCRRGMRKPWTKEEDEMLRNAVNTYLVQLGYAEGVSSVKTIQESNAACKRIPWDEIQAKFDGDVRKIKDVRKRWTTSLDPNLKKGKWTEEEDEQLKKSFEKWGAHWLKISTEISGRTEDQCAKRYIEVLDPSTRDRLRSWSIEEDLALISKVKKYGTRWRKISREMESRPSLTCRNRWRKIITMIMRGKATEVIVRAVQESSDSQGLRTVEELKDSLELKLNSNTNNNSSSNTSENASPSESSNMRTSAPQEIKQESLRNPGLPIHTKTGSSNEQGAQITDNARQNFKGSELRDSATSGRRQEGEENISGMNGEESAGQMKKPYSTLIDWEFSVKDSAGQPLSQGKITNSALVKELIEGAKKDSLKISIHQHIHNHYEFLPQLNPLLSQSFANDLLAPMSPEAFSPDKNERIPSAFGLDTELMPNSPNFPGMTGEAGLSLEQLATSHQFATHAFYSPRISSRLSSFYQQRQRPTSSTGSRSTPEENIDEIGPSRQYHFNVLPATVRPKLGSSNTGRSPDSNPATSRSFPNRINKTRKRSGRGNRSKNATPTASTASSAGTPYPSVATSYGEDKMKIGSNRTPSTISANGEEEGLDFWESLRSLASVPNSHPNSKGEPDERFTSYEFLYNPYEEQSSNVEHEETVKANTNAAHQESVLDLESCFGNIPFNPS
ncbi:LAMI_0B00386g1_1 [Lachancea mirantina]|uniref:LAMI_0B00386g1_1 n=1 Tax=Lachancea mirantina TaxID=1230905 RepID=A0A1G4ITJ1_9SACH|nr:LAMI_0B00386g1_1 [Lachancea mirantina]